MTAFDPDLPPGSLAHPAIEEILAFAADPTELLRERYYRYGPIFTMHLPTPNIFAIGPAAHEAIYQRFSQSLSSARAWPGYMSAIFGPYPYVLRDGSPAQNLKHLTGCAFRSETLGWTFERVLGAISRCLRSWDGGAPIRFFPEARSLVFEALWELLAGPMPPDPRLRRALEDLHRALTAAPGAGLRRCTTPAPEAVFAAQAQRRARVFAKTVLLRELTRIVDERRTRPERDVLSLWVQARDKQGRGMSDIEILSHALLFVVVGVDTVASMLTWLLYALHRHADVRENVRLEMASVGGPGPLRHDDLKQLIYTNAVLKEVERCYPTTLGSVRTVVKPFEFEGYRFPLGWKVRTCTTLSHGLPEIFASPTRFDPTRFMPPRSEDAARPYPLIGFGAGPRQCPGRPFASMFLSAFASIVVRDFEWHVPVYQDFRPRFHNLSVFVPGDQLRIGFSPRWPAPTQPPRRGDGARVLLAAAPGDSGAGGK